VARVDPFRADHGPESVERALEISFADAWRDAHGYCRLVVVITAPRAVAEPPADSTRPPSPLANEPDRRCRMATAAPTGAKCQTNPYNQDYCADWRDDPAMSPYRCPLAAAGRTVLQAFAVAAIALLGQAPATAQEGHPLKGSWLGTWAGNEAHGENVLLVLDWDGQNITGIINPGTDNIAITKA